VAGIPAQSFLARKHGELISTCSTPEGWAAPLSAVAADDAATALGALPTAANADDEQAKRFDLVVLRRQLAQLEGYDEIAARTRASMQDVASQLLEKQTIPQVASAAELLQEVAGEDGWEGVTLAMLERARRGLRLLVQFLGTRRPGGGSPRAAAGGRGRGLVGGRAPGDARAGAARPAPARAVPRHAQTREHRHRLRGRSRRSPLRRPSAGGRGGGPGPVP